MSWRPAISLEVLRDEVNALWPARSKDSDGMIGDAAHAASASDHNPNAARVVCAFDITHDPNGPTGTDLAERLRARRHPDFKYAIWSGRMFSAYAAHGVAPFEWRPYPGADPHTNHVHVSVGVGPDGQSQPPYDDPDPWLEEDTLTDEEHAALLFARDNSAWLAGVNPNTSPPTPTGHGIPRVERLLEAIAIKLGVDLSKVPPS